MDTIESFAAAVSRVQRYRPADERKLDPYWLTLDFWEAFYALSEDFDGGDSLTVPSSDSDIVSALTLSKPWSWGGVPLTPKSGWLDWYEDEGEINRFPIVRLYFVTPDGRHILATYDEEDDSEDDVELELLDPGPDPNDFRGDPSPVIRGVLWMPNGESYKEDAARLFAWTILNPDLMEKKPRDLRSKAERRQRNKSKPDRPRTVTIVDLRAAHREAAADVAAAERTYRSRWIVRGHWHRFWTGPRDGERKLETRYVMPYVKGPAGAPLNVTERVKKW